MISWLKSCSCDIHFIQHFFSSYQMTDFYFLMSKEWLTLRRYFTARGVDPFFGLGWGGGGQSRNIKLCGCPLPPPPPPPGSTPLFTARWFSKLLLQQIEHIRGYPRGLLTFVNKRLIVFFFFFFIDWLEVPDSRQTMCSHSRLIYWMKA